MQNLSRLLPCKGAATHKSQYADSHGVDVSGDYAETNQTVLNLPEDVGGAALELLLHGIYLQEVLAHMQSHLLLLISLLVLSLSKLPAQLCTAGADTVQQGQC